MKANAELDAIVARVAEPGRTAAVLVVWDAAGEMHITGVLPSKASAIGALEEAIRQFQIGDPVSHGKVPVPS